MHLYNKYKYKILYYKLGVIPNSNDCYKFNKSVISLFSTLPSSKIYIYLFFISSL